MLFNVGFHVSSVNSGNSISIAEICSPLLVYLCVRVDVVQNLNINQCLYSALGLFAQQLPV